MGRKISRRNFIKETTAAGMGLSLGISGINAKSYNRILGSNDRVNFAVIGIRSRGATHIDSISVCENAALKYICDVDKRYIDEQLARLKEKNMSLPETEKDFRKILESKDVDAITIATPEHWHAPMAIAGLQAGKHVYVEKPSSHNPAEGEMIIQAQKKYKKLVQMGNQQRSSIHTSEAMKKIHDGVVGRAYLARAWYSNGRKSINVGKEVAVPDYLDWELWQGPAPRRPYKDNVHPYNWHWFWHWGTGETLNNATHEIDLCLWALDVKYPDRITANGGRYHYKDDWEFYDTLLTTFEYGDKMISWEGKSCNPMPYFDRGRGVTIHGTEGTVLIDRNGYAVYNINNEKTFEFMKPEMDETTGLAGGGPMTDMHFQNFVNGIIKAEQLNAPIEMGQIPVNMLLLSNIAWKTGQILEIDSSNGHVKDKTIMEKHWGREYEPGWEPKV